jgi:hypothetical protein
MKEKIKKLPRVSYLKTDHGMGEIRILNCNTKFSIPVNIENPYGVKGLYIEKYTDELLYENCKEESDILIGEFSFGKVYKKTKGNRNFILVYDDTKIVFDGNIPSWVWA